MSGLRSLYAAARYLSRGEAEALAKRALSFSTADEARVSLQSGVRGNTRYAVNQISTAGDNYNVTVTVLSAFGRRSASVTTNRLDDEGLRSAVQSSERLARLAPEDPERMPELGPQQYQEGKGWSESTASLEPAGRAAAVRQVTEPSRAADLSATGFLQADAGSVAVATSKGLFAYGRQTASSMTTTVRTADGTGSGWAGAAHHDFSRIDAQALGARAIEKARLSRNPVAIEPGRYTVVLEPTAVGNLVQLIAFALNARNADEGRSFFTRPGGGNKIGMKVVDERVTLVSDPLDPEAYANTFSAEGLPVARTPWIENGVVRNLAYDRFWAQKQGRAPMPLIGSLRMPGGDATLDAMIASTDRGILVTRFWYIRPVDPRTILYTGLTRDGTFLIEKGKITRAVKNLRFNESPIFMLNNLEAMGQPMRVSASEDGSPGFAVVVPPIKVRDFTFTSLSDAV
jgi:predicted Zn-dependent protease